MANAKGRSKARQPLGLALRLQALRAEFLVEGALKDPVSLLSFLPAHFLCSGFRLKIEMEEPL